MLSVLSTWTSGHGSECDGEWSPVEVVAHLQHHTGTIVNMNNCHNTCEEVHDTKLSAGGDRDDQDQEDDQGGGSQDQ